MTPEREPLTDAEPYNWPCEREGWITELAAIPSAGRVSYAIDQLMTLQSRLAASAQEIAELRAEREQWKPIIDDYRDSFAMEKKRAEKAEAERDALRAAIAEAASELPHCSGPLAERIRVYRAAHSEQVDALRAEAETERADLLDTISTLAYMAESLTDPAKIVCRARAAIDAAREGK